MSNLLVFFLHLPNLKFKKWKKNIFLNYFYHLFLNARNCICYLELTLSITETAFSSLYG